MEDLAKRILLGDVRAIARLISLLENSRPEALPHYAAIFGRTGHGYVLGVTGAPGAGKSTLVDGLVGQARAQGHTVAVLAVDPSSPFTGGAILGDRIRMQGHAADSGVYIRSMGTRGQLGGLALATRQAVHVLDAAGYDLIIVETVGVGQSELDIAAAADSTLVVTTPGMGDTIQTMKAGILEIADIFALNKADQEGAPQALQALRGMLRMGQARDWMPPVVETQAHQGVGLEALWHAIAAHRAHLERTGTLQSRRADRLRDELRDAVERGLRTDVLRRLTQGSAFETLAATVIARQCDPQQAARSLLTDLQERATRIEDNLE